MGIGFVIFKFNPWKNSPFETLLPFKTIPAFEFLFAEAQPASVIAADRTGITIFAWMLFKQVLLFIRNIEFAHKPWYRNKWHDQLLINVLKLLRFFKNKQKIRGFKFYKMNRD